MTTRQDATYDLIMLALGAVDELWGSIYDRVKAWAGEETSDQVAAAMVGWRETYEAQEKRIERIENEVAILQLDMGKWGDLRDRIAKLEERVKGNEGLWRGHNDFHLTLAHRIAGLDERNGKLETRDQAGTKILEEHCEKIAKLETALQELDAGHEDVMRKTAMIIAAGVGR